LLEIKSWESWFFPAASLFDLVRSWLYQAAHESHGPLTPSTLAIFVTKMQIYPDFVSDPEVSSNG
jgi:hypothetical protein